MYYDQPSNRNIANNNFSGMIPQGFSSIPNLMYAQVCFTFVFSILIIKYIHADVLVQLQPQSWWKLICQYACLPATNSEAT
jgi:hypothetical protein